MPATWPPKGCRRYGHALRAVPGVAGFNASSPADWLAAAVQAKARQPLFVIVVAAAWVSIQIAAGGVVGVVRLPGGIPAVTAQPQIDGRGVAEDARQVDLWRGSLIPCRHLSRARAGPAGSEAPSGSLPDDRRRIWKGSSLAPQVVPHHQCSRGALAGRRGGLLGRPGPHVAGGEDTGQGGHQG